MIGLLEPEEYVRCVETAFRRMGEGRVFMEPKGHIVLDKYPGEWEIMPSYIEEPEGAPAAAACKWVSIRFENRARFNLPTVFSILIYTEPETGFPLAIVDGTHHTLMRTGASGAVSAKWMAREDSSVLALVGCRRREHRRLPHLRGNARLEGSPGLEPDPGDAGRVHGSRAAAPPGRGNQAVHRSRRCRAGRRCRRHRDHGRDSGPR